MVSLESITWDELINYSPQVSLKNRPKILIKLNDIYNRIYFGVVVKHDINKNILIRYFDNPSAGKLWWTGNKDGNCGLDRSQYSSTVLGDIYDDMLNLSEKDFCEDGYDDIINFENESDRFYRSTSNYPFLNGNYGNIYLFEYFMKLYENNNKIYYDDESSTLPNEVLLDLNNPHYKRTKVNDFIEIFLMKSNIKNDNLKNLKNYLCYKLNRRKIINIINKHNLDLIDISFIESIKSKIKNNLMNNIDNIIILYLLSEILEISVTIYEYNNLNLSIKNINNCFDNKIYLYKYNNKYQLIILDNEKYKNEDNKIEQNNYP